MKLSGERIFNLCLGGSFLFWAIAGFLADENYSIIRILISGLNFTLGCLILFRFQAQSFGQLSDILKSLPSLILGGIIFRLAASPDSWSNAAICLFSAGMVITIGSFLSLGRSFSILPQKRSVVTRGFYQIIRHPGYVGETLLLVACVYSSEQLLYSLMGLLLFIPFISWRILVEESLLVKDPIYQEYMSRVKWRVIPGLW